MYQYLLATASDKNSFSIKESILAGWEAFLKNYLPYVLFVAIGAAINYICYQIPLVGGFLLLLIGLPMQLGTSIYYHHTLVDEPTENTKWQYFYKGFSKWIDLTTLLIIILVALVMAFIPLAVFAATLDELKIFKTQVSETEEWSLKIASYLLSPFAFYAIICLALAPYFIYFYEVKAWASIKLSFKFIKNKFWHFTLFYLCVLAINTLAGFTLIGLAITVPVTSIANFEVFKKIVGEKMSSKV
jgi:uncharacterized membrane protein